MLRGIKRRARERGENKVKLKGVANNDAILKLLSLLLLFIKGWTNAIYNFLINYSLQYYNSVGIITKLFSNFFH